MRDEDFVLGYVAGYNDGVGSGGGGSGGIVIKDGASVYDVPIIHNYNLIGTDYGLATFDVNECAFLNITPSGGSDMSYHKNPITGEIEVYKRTQPTLLNRSIGYALTKGGKAIGIFKAQSASYQAFLFGYDPVRIEDGTIMFLKSYDRVSTVENPIITWTEAPYGSDEKQMKVYMEFDIVSKTINYSQPSKYYNEDYGFGYYRKADLEAQTITSENSSSYHSKIQINTFGAKTTILENSYYPEEWLNKYMLGGIPNPIFGISIMDNFELTTSLFDGIE